MVNSLYISYNGMTEPIVQSQVLPYLKGLVKRGINFTLVTYEKRRLGVEEKESIRRGLKEDAATGCGIEWSTLTYHKGAGLFVKALDVIAGFFYVSHIILKRKIDVVHARAIVAAVVGYPAARLFSKKFIFDTRGIDSEEYVDANLWKRGGLRHRIVGRIEDLLTRSSDHVIVLTDAFLNILKERHKGYDIDFSVIPCAVDTERFRRGDASGLKKSLGLERRFIFVYSGSLGTWYMFSEMLDFFKSAAKIIKDAHFLILTQADASYASGLMEKSGIGSEQFTLKYISHDSMPEYLSICDAGIFFIKRVFSKLSSSPVKFGEYLSSGLPVIINSGIGDTAEIVNNNKAGVVIDNFDNVSYESAVRVLCDLLKEGDVRRRCRETAKKYLSLSAAVDKYEAIYKHLG